MSRSLTATEENYIKAIFELSDNQQRSVNTNAIARELSTSAASVTDMLKKLSEKELIDYQRYHGVQLKSTGLTHAHRLLRRHRLWEVFLVDKLGFSWDEVHELAEQLEHIDSAKLDNRLDQFLGFPKVDPHGDPIPDAEGKFALIESIALDRINIGAECVLLGVEEDRSSFLKQLNQLQLALGCQIKILDKFDFDQSLLILINQERECMISQKLSQKLLVSII